MKELTTRAGGGPADIAIGWCINRELRFSWNIGKKLGFVRRGD